LTGADRSDAPVKSGDKEVSASRRTTHLAVPVTTEEKK
jgi:hypothetical protein